MGYALEGNGSLHMLPLERAEKFFSKGNSLEDDPVLLDVVYLERRK